MQILDSTGAVAAVQDTQNQALTARTPRTFAAAWDVPFTVREGAYSVNVTVFQQGTSTIIGSASGPSFTVQSPSLTTSASASPNQVARGATTAVSARVGTDLPTTVLVYLVVVDSSGQFVFQQAFDNVDLTPGQATLLAANWAVPGAAAPGPYTMKVGIFNPGWGTLVDWNDAAGTLTVR